MPADGLEPKLLSADAAIKAALETEPQSSLTNFGQAIAWSRDNIAKPAANAGVIEPYAVVAHSLNSAAEQAGGRPLVTEPERFPVPPAEFMTPSWFAQNISSGLAMVLPYTLAGRATGSGLGMAARVLELEGAAASVIASEKTAMILGAGLYDGLKKTEPGQTHLGNAAGSMAAFTAFEFGNPLLGKTMGLGKVAGLMTIGAAGSAAHLTASELISQGKLPGLEQLTSAGLTGSVMNAVLPYAQSAVMRPFAAEGAFAREQPVVIRTFSNEPARPSEKASTAIDQQPVVIRTFSNEPARPSAGKVSGADLQAAGSETPTTGGFKWENVPLLGRVVSRARKMSDGLHNYINETVEGLPDTLDNMSTAYGGNRRELTTAERQEKVIKQMIFNNTNWFGKDSPYGVHARMMLADLYASQYRIYEASKQYEQAVAILGQHREPGHPELGETYSKLGNYYSRSAKEPLAEKYLNLAIENKSIQFGSDSLELTGDLQKLAEVSNAQGKTVEAEAALLRVNQIMEKNLDPLDGRLADSLYALKSFYGASGRQAEAAAVNEQMMLTYAAETVRTALGDEHLQFGRTLEDLSSFYRRQGKPELAARMQNDIKIVELANKVKQPDYPGLERDLRALAEAYRKRDHGGDRTVAFRTEARANAMAQARLERAKRK